MSGGRPKAKSTAFASEENRPSRSQQEAEQKSDAVEGGSAPFHRMSSKEHLHTTHRMFTIVSFLLLMGVRVSRNSRDSKTF
jgi:hypothetical protein